MRGQCRSPAGTAALMLFSALLFLVSAPHGAEPDKLIEADIVWFEEQEPGTEVYPVRFLVTAGHLRIDDGVDEGDYILMDRRTQSVFSVSHMEQTTVEFGHRAVQADIPASLTLTEEIREETGAPSIAGRTPQHARFLANDSTCYEAIIVPGLMQSVADALGQYARVLGDRQLHTLANVPADIQTPCYLSRYAYAPAVHYRLGLPIREWDERGYRRSLVNFSESAKVDPALFEVPDSYRLLRPGG